MTLEMFQKVFLKDGRKGHIIEIFNDGEAYMVDVKRGDGGYDQDTVYPKDIKSIIVEVEKPFAIK